MTVFYDGALSALHHIKAQGSAQVIDTDTEASSLIRRVWLLARNARASGGLARETDLLSLFDQFYCQPSIEDDTAILSDIPDDFVSAFKNKITIWRDGRKPSPVHMRRILNDFDVDSADALYIGDSAKDSGCARPLGVDFAWFTPGADTAPEIAAIAQQLASPLYKYGLESIRADFTAVTAPNYAFTQSLSDIIRAFSFSVHTAATQDASAHISGNQAPQSPGDPVLLRLLPSPPRTGHRGPAHHFPPHP